MIVENIKTNNFRNLSDAEIQFQVGLNVIKGPNEAGKTALLNAIRLSLFGDATTTSAEVQAQKRWESRSSFSIETNFNENNQIFIISRDYENKRNSIILPDGTSFKNKKRMQEKIMELIGFPSEKCFNSTVCICQDEIREIEAGIPEIRSLLEEKISGGNIDPNHILNSLNKENVELKRAGQKNPGLIKQTEDRLNELKTKLAALKDVVQKMDKYRKELSEVLEKLSHVTKDLNLKDRAVKSAKRYVDAKRRHDELSKRYDEIDKTIERRRKNTQELERVSKELEAVTIKLKTKEEELNKTERVRTLRSKKEEYDKVIIEISSDIDRLGSLEKELVDIEQRLSQKADIDEKDYKNALRLPGEIDSLAMALSAQEVIVSVTPKKKLNLTYKTDSSEKQIKGLDKSEKFTISGKEQIELQIEDIADIDVIRKGEEVRAVLNECKRKKEVFNYILKRYEASSVEGLKQLWEERQELLKDKNNKGIEFKTILNNRKREDINKQKEQLVKEVEPLTKEIEKIKDYSMSQDAFESLKKEVVDLRDEVKELEKSKHLNMGALKDVEPEEKLKEELKVITKDMAVGRVDVGELAMFKCTGEEFLKYESEFTELQEELNNLIVRKRFLEMSIAADEKAGIEDTADLEEEISFLAEENYRLKRKAEVNDIISDILQEARTQTIKDISDDLCRKIEEYLSYITGGKYKTIKLGDNLNMSLWSDQKNGWLDSSNFYSELSSGLFDQVYFAIRIALAEVIVSPRVIPIFMDDPFVHFDSQRRKKAIELCKLLSGNHQILIFTCHDYCDEFADFIIELGRP